jgi:uncharacterized protein YndB with AHSA1/START domain
MGTTEIKAPDGLPFVDIRRTFKGSPELLFRAHSEPDLLARWLGPRKYALIIDRYDVRDGGSWRYVNRDDAGNEYGFHGVFHGPQSTDGMTQTFEYEGAPGHVSLDHLTFEAQGDETVVHIHTVFQSVEARDGMIAGGMESGMNDGYERLDELLASMLAPTH